MKGGGGGLTSPPPFPFPGRGGRTTMSGTAADSTFAQCVQPPDRAPRMQHIHAPPPAHAHTRARAHTQPPSPGRACRGGGGAAFLIPSSHGARQVRQGEIHRGRMAPHVAAAAGARLPGRRVAPRARRCRDGHATAARKLPPRRGAARVPVRGACADGAADPHARRSRTCTSLAGTSTSGAWSPSRAHRCARSPCAATSPSSRRAAAPVARRHCARGFPGGERMRRRVRSGGRGTPRRRRRCCERTTWSSTPAKPAATRLSKVCPSPGSAGGEHDS